ncbi:peptidase M18, aminopeptidase I [Hyphopichia burtonii NRRL Y-1933]|uniref:aspartyl aminopeptidase n=1 Tax=Hyphopichia burtonii NRRL Y-1933 TaxID=984485 RepID=A0A1E4RS32_9ASCO|nr:peptidase M18, aminopeptidase I [Hyphopichia burtonii NRRL Y-1933]ODV70082.1 peptidase M18, aminopeptidase I [Hyphopichia burtonii NRRL Y-1933]
MLTKEEKANALEYANGLVDYVNKSPTPYHAIKTTSSKLVEAGFVQLSERENWNKQEKVRKGGKYFVTRNDSSIVAFTVGGEYKEGNGLAIVGGHTDSPCLRLKPKSLIKKHGFIQIGVEQYGGMIAHTWFDRDLSVAGKVYILDSTNGQLIPKLVKIDKPLLRIPTLAIHLNREANQKFEFDKETKLLPIAGQVSLDKNASTKHDERKSCADDPDLKLTSEQFESVQSVITRHSQSLVELIADELSVSISQIEDFELVLFDHQKSVIGGLNDEFVFSPRLDNLTTCFTATNALIEASKEANENQDIIRIMALFDHEEIGSVSFTGADSSFLLDIIQRLGKISFDSSSNMVDNFHQVVSNSFLLSSDQAHGVHPNYSEFYETNHSPHVNLGPVIKINANQRYATNSSGIVLIKRIAEKVKVPLQLFVVKNGSPCGSTIGPMLSAKLGMRTLDLGNPQLSMHSIRETGGSYDVIQLNNLFKGFYLHYNEVDQCLQRL